MLKITITLRSPERLIRQVISLLNQTTKRLSRPAGKSFFIAGVGPSYNEQSLAIMVVEDPVRFRWVVVGIHSVPLFLEVTKSVFGYTNLWNFPAPQGGDIEKLVSNIMLARGRNFGLTSGR